VLVDGATATRTAGVKTFSNARFARGIITVRQQPGTATGTVFVTLEDETGNVIIWQRQHHVMRLVDWPHVPGKLDTGSRNFD
jgi:DNA-binding beta-propeller fold protein YncE